MEVIVLVCCSQMCVLAYLVAAEYFALQKARLNAEAELRADEPLEEIAELQAKYKELHAQFQSLKLGKRA